MLFAVGNNIIRRGNNIVFRGNNVIRRYSPLFAEGNTIIRSGGILLFAALFAVIRRLFAEGNNVIRTGGITYLYGFIRLWFCTLPLSKVEPVHLALHNLVKFPLTAHAFEVVRSEQTLRLVPSDRIVSSFVLGLERLIQSLLDILAT